MDITNIEELQGQIFEATGRVDNMLKVINELSLMLDGIKSIESDAIFEAWATGAEIEGLANDIRSKLGKANSCACGLEANYNATGKVSYSQVISVLKPNLEDVSSDLAIIVSKKENIEYLVSLVKGDLEVTTNIRVMSEVIDALELEAEDIIKIIDNCLENLRLFYGNN